VKVVDFGLARFLDTTSGEAPTAARLTRSGVLLGTPAYMSPEQIRGEQADERTDVFALGVLVYECATGVHPFIGKSAESTMAHVLEKEIDLGLLDSRGMGALVPVIGRPPGRSPPAAIDRRARWLARSRR